MPSLVVASHCAELSKTAQARQSSTTRVNSGQAGTVVARSLRATVNRPRLNASASRTGSSGDKSAATYGGVDPVGLAATRFNELVARKLSVPAALPGTDR